MLNERFYYIATIFGRMCDSLFRLYKLAAIRKTKKNYMSKKRDIDVSKEAINIPIAPARHDFESKADWKVFSLYFEPIPIVDCSINIIEEENPDSKDFNYYDIKLEQVKEVEMVNESV